MNTWITTIREKYSIAAPAILVIYLCGFLYFPSSQTHNVVFYAALILPLVWVALQEALLLARTNWLAQVTFLFILYMCTSSIWNPDYDSKEIFRSFKLGFFCLSYIAIVVHLTGRHREFLDKWLRLAPFILTLGAIITAAVWYQGHNFPHHRISGWGRVDYPGNLATMAALAIVIALSCYDSATRNMKLAYAFCINVLALFIILTQSLLGVVVAVIASIPFLVIMRMQLLRIVLPALLLIGIGGFLYPNFLIVMLTETGGWARVDIWAHVIEASGDSWLFGHGLKADFDYLHYFEQYDKSILFNRTHNVYLACLFHGGIVGLVLHLFITAAALVVLFTRARHKNSYTYFAMMLTGAVAIAGDWSHVIDHPGLLYLFYWLPLAIAISTIKQEQLSRSTVEDL